MVSHVVRLDAGPLGIATNPRCLRQRVACAYWLQALVTHGTRVMVPDMADDERRRELLRPNNVSGRSRLDALATLLEYLPITPAALRQAAVFWAQARQQSQPTADDRALDGDVVLAAQVLTRAVTAVVIATANVAHPSRCAVTTLCPDIAARELMLAALARMARHEGPLMLEWPRLRRSPLHLDAWSDRGPRGPSRSWSRP